MRLGVFKSYNGNPHVLRDRYARYETLIQYSEINVYWDSRLEKHVDRAPYILAPYKIYAAMIKKITETEHSACYPKIPTKFENPRDLIDYLQNVVSPSDPETSLNTLDTRDILDSPPNAEVESPILAPHAPKKVRKNRFVYVSGAWRTLV